MFSEGFNKPAAEPLARWESEDVQPTILAERLRFPYACNVLSPNRLMKSAMSEQLASYAKEDMQKSGIPTRELIHLFEKFGSGGAGIVITGSIAVNGKDLEAPGNVIIDKELDSEERRAAFKEWTTKTKANGNIFLAQLLHPGSKAADLPHKTNFDVNSLKRNEIKELIEQYAYAALYAQQCGFDGVEISCAYYYALGEFLTEGMNNRKDEFGGSLENRSRLLFKIIQAIRMRVNRPSNFVIGLKLFSGNFEPGYDEEQFGDFIHSVEKTGFDYITVTGGNYNLLKNLKAIAKESKQKHEHFYQTVVFAIKKNLTRTKLYMNGGFVSLSDMCDAISAGWTAGISIARPLAAEPDLPKRLLSGEVKGAVKSLIDPLDMPLAQQIAGTQLWQHASDLKVLDASDPHQMEQFQRDLAKHKERILKAQEDGSGPVVGYANSIICSEVIDDEIRPPDTAENAVFAQQDSQNSDSTAQNKELSMPEDEMLEEKVHSILKKEIESPVEVPVEMHQRVVEDSVHKVVKRHSDLEGEGNIEIIEETMEKVTRSQVDYTETKSADVVHHSLDDHATSEETFQKFERADDASVPVGSSENTQHLDATSPENKGEEFIKDLEPSQVPHDDLEKSNHSAEKKESHVASGGDIHEQAAATEEKASPLIAENLASNIEPKVKDDSKFPIPPTSSEVESDDKTVVEVVQEVTATMLQTVNEEIPHPQEQVHLEKDVITKSDEVPDVMQIPEGIIETSTTSVEKKSEDEELSAVSKTPEIHEDANKEEMISEKQTGEDEESVIAAVVTSALEGVPLAEEKSEDSITKSEVISGLTSENKTVIAGIATEQDHTVNEVKDNNVDLYASKSTPAAEETSHTDEHLSEGESEERKIQTDEHKEAPQVTSSGLPESAIRALSDSPDHFAFTEGDPFEGADSSTVDASHEFQKVPGLEVCPEEPAVAENAPGVNSTELDEKISDDRHQHEETVTKPAEDSMQLKSEEMENISADEPSSKHNILFDSLSERSEAAAEEAEGKEEITTTVSEEKIAKDLNGDVVHEGHQLNKKESKEAESQHEQSEKFEAAADMPSENVDPSAPQASKPGEKFHGISGFLKSALPDSVQNLFSSSKGKTEEALSESSESKIDEKNIEVTSEEHYRENEAHGDVIRDEQKPLDLHKDGIKEIVAGITANNEPIIFGLVSEGSNENEEHGNASAHSTAEFNSLHEVREDITTGAVRDHDEKHESHNGFEELHVEATGYHEVKPNGNVCDAKAGKQPEDADFEFIH